MSNQVTGAQLPGRRKNLRRLSALSAAATLSGCKTLSSSSQGPPPAALIDIHCHVFNVRDMPAYAFVMDIALNAPLLHDYASPAAKLLVAITRAAAPDFHQERDALQLIQADPSVAATVTHSSAFPDALFVAGLQQFITRYQPFPANPPSVPASETTFVELLVNTFLPGVVDFTQPPAVVVASIVANAPALAAAMRNALAPGGGIDLKSYLAQFLMYWAPRLADYRFQLINELAASSGGSPPPPRLMTPATLDITAWLQDSVIDYAPLSMSDQAELMRLISLIQPPGQVVHGFVGFDPWHQVDDLAQGRPVTALDVVKTALQQKGFAGVKVYPPMGFRATNNASIADSDFPPLPVAYPGIGARLDAALDSLYAYCAANDVPIMTHCAASEATSDEYALRADPMFWQYVLDTPGYQNLRVNLSHFGGIWNFDNTPPTQSDPHVTWTNAIAVMIQSGNYPNLYTDIGDFSAILDRTPAETADTNIILANLNALVVANPALPTRIMYGTDWLLLGREPQSLGYYASITGQLGSALGVSDLSDLLWRNASRFLGLAMSQATRTRLSNFYTANGGDPTVLASFG